VQKRLAQLAGRPRNCVQPDLYICIGASRWCRTPGDNLDEMAQNKVMNEYQESLVPAIVDGRLERTLPDTPTTVARLQLARAAIEENDPDWKISRVNYGSDSSTHLGEAPGYGLAHKNDEHWDKIDQPDQTRNAWNTQAVFLTSIEARTAGLKAVRRKDVSAWP
jgi:hypothetical protein